MPLFDIAAPGLPACRRTRWGQLVHQAQELPPQASWCLLAFYVLGRMGYLCLGAPCIDPGWTPAGTRGSNVCGSRQLVHLIGTDESKKALVAVEDFPRFLAYQPGVSEVRRFGRLCGAAQPVQPTRTPDDGGCGATPPGGRSHAAANGSCVTRLFQASWQNCQKLFDSGMK